MTAPTNTAEPANTRVLWVTGAGSGMGRAAAVAAAPGRRVAVSGRRTEPLAETAALTASAVLTGSPRTAGSVAGVR